MGSIRFPGKVLFEFFGYPMIEHVRRRACLSNSIDDVFVATDNCEVANSVEKHGGKVILTSNKHKNGTSRVAEAAEQIDASHILLLQGDEPLLLPSYVDSMVKSINEAPNGDAWNATGPIETTDEVDRHSFVKCVVAPNTNIMYCFRRGLSHAPLEHQQAYLRKVLGIIAFRKEFLQHLVKLKPARTEVTDSIEQMRILENGYKLTSVPFNESLPSVNEPHEVTAVVEFMNKKSIQRELLVKTFGVDFSKL